MAIPPNIALKIIYSYTADNIANLFAQSSASHILYEVGEDELNFPRFDTSLVDKVTASAYAILAAGISLLEAGESVVTAQKAIEEAATLLHNVHDAHAKDNVTSRFHILISSMAFYISGQYSRAFVSIRGVESDIDLAKMIAAFIRKQFDQLILVLNPYILSNLLIDDDGNICELAVTTATARSLSLALEFLISGASSNIDEAIAVLLIGQQVAQDYESPSLWWITRLLSLMLKGLKDASLWSVLPPFYPNNKPLLNKYIRLMMFGKPSVTELWHSQQKAIPQALDYLSRGAVINLRTSAGKTRVAELAILQTLSQDADAKVLYLAPFRSLALEIEHSLSQIFDWCDCRVSHLYGGFRVSSTDRLLVEESRITIATPEKARAILRSSPDFFNNIKLIVVDEGHLIGSDDRLIKNELFIEHLRIIAHSINARILLLSAVLPNAEQLAEWITGSSTQISRSQWKPSTERFGLLRWNGSHVRIEWRGDFECFNPKFVESKPLGFSKRRNNFPIDKKEAIAATAVRLANVGPVMIFSARANSIEGLAKAVILALGENISDHAWPPQAWQAFKAICEEELPVDAFELKSARYGIICHSNSLPSQVRIAIERLMRSAPPKIIIATTTLGQGVNIGISSVIVASPYISDQPINHRDFWNICGRAGRAYIDGEGKILYAIDEVITHTNKSAKVRKEHALAKTYFDAALSNPVESGLLYIAIYIKSMAESLGVNFEQLITMIAENDFSAFGDEISAKFDLIDDAILALQEDSFVNPTGDAPEVWVDNVFRRSLASIQANTNNLINSDEFVRLIKTRAESLIRVYPSPSERKTYVSTGLPLSTAHRIYRDRDQFVQIAQTLINDEMSLNSIIEFSAWIENWARHNASAIVKNIASEAVMTEIREKWINARPMRDIIAESTSADSICKDVYGFQLPWLIHAASQQLRQMGHDNLCNTLSSIALLVELGVPSELSAWVFLAGVGSRVSATEIANCGVNLGDSYISVRQTIRNPHALSLIAQRVSEPTKILINQQIKNTQRTPIEFFSERIIFVPEDIFGSYDTLIIRRLNNGLIYICSVDGKAKILVNNLNISIGDKLSYEKLANDYRFAFTRDRKYLRELYKLTIRDPRLMDQYIEQSLNLGL